MSGSAHRLPLPPLGLLLPHTALGPLGFDQGVHVAVPLKRAQL